MKPIVDEALAMTVRKTRMTPCGIFTRVHPHDDRQMQIVITREQQVGFLYSFFTEIGTQFIADEFQELENTIMYACAPYLESDEYDDDHWSHELDGALANFKTNFK